MVCLGNICRSPLAEGLLKSKLPSDKFEVESAGTANYHVGDSPDQRSIEIAKFNKLDISQQRGRQFKAKDFDEFDYIYVMDRSNMADVLSLARNNKDTDKVKLILDEIPGNHLKEVPDPYYGGKDGFANVYKMLDDATDKIAEKILK